MRVPGIDDFHPEPDLLVINAGDLLHRYIRTYYLVAEIISPSNTAEMIGRKLELYQRHPDNLYCLTINHDVVHATLYSREGGWQPTDLRSLDDVLRLPAFGFEVRLADIYKGTPLASAT